MRGGVVVGVGHPVVVGVVKTDEKTESGDRLYVVQHVVTIVLDTPPKEDRE